METLLECLATCLCLSECLRFQFPLLLFFRVMLPVGKFHSHCACEDIIREKPLTFSNLMTLSNLSCRSVLWEITKILASLITYRIILRNSSVPKPSSEESNTSSIISRLVLTEFLTRATSLQVKRSARSILIFSPSLKEL